MTAKSSTTASNDNKPVSTPVFATLLFVDSELVADVPELAADGSVFILAFNNCICALAKGLDFFCAEPEADRASILLDGGLFRPSELLDLGNAFAI